jgi:hypothetical protein
MYVCIYVCVYACLWINSSQRKLCMHVCNSVCVYVCVRINHSQRILQDFQKKHHDWNAENLCIFMCLSVCMYAHTHMHTHTQPLRVHPQEEEEEPTHEEDFTFLEDETNFASAVASVLRSAAIPKEKRETEVKAPKPERVLFLFSPNSRLRKFFIFLSKQWWFDSIVYMAILSSCVILSLEPPAMDIPGEVRVCVCVCVCVCAVVVRECV